MIGRAAHPGRLAAGRLGRRGHLAGVGLEIGRGTHQAAGDLVEMRAELLCEL
nr:hypothetical protein [Bradyrhizobium zhanjiangense]